MTRYTFRHSNDDGSVTEHDLIEATVAEWRDLPESRSSAWSVIRTVGGRVKALAAVAALPGAPVTRQPSTADSGEFSALAGD